LSPHPWRCSENV